MADNIEGDNINNLINSANEAVRSTLDLVNAQKEELDLQNKINQVIKESNKSISGYLKTRVKTKEIEKENLVLKNQINISEKELVEIQKKVATLNALELNDATKLTSEQKKQLENLRLNLTTIENNKKAAEGLLVQNEKLVSSLNEQQNILKSITNQSVEAIYETSKRYFSLKEIFGFFEKADRAIKDVNLTLGKSGGASTMLRDNMIDASMYAASLGLAMEDLSKIQLSYANITGKISGLRADEIASISEIAKGTSLGADGAAEMVGNFELMGYSANRLNKFVTNTVNTNQKLGVNSDKVLKNINSQFANFNKFRFQNGIESFAKMAQLAETTKITMEDTFSAIDKFRTLQGTLEASARLMSLGGKFAQADPFKLSFLARNKPEEFQAELAKMTNGLATFNQKTKSFQLSAIDMDRLREVAEATNVSFDSLVKSATESSKINFANKSILIGTKEDKELIGRLAKFGDNGKMVVDVEGSQVALDKITNAQLQAIKANFNSDKTLRERAEANMTFNDIVVNFIHELQSSLLPLLKNLNNITTTMRTFFNSLSTNSKTILAATGVFVVIVGSLVAAVKSMGGLSNLGGGLFNGIGGGIKGIFSKGSKAAAATGSNVAGNAVGGAGSGGAVATSKGISGNFTYAASLLAIGAAAVGIGYGIKLATDGFTNLASAIGKLDKTQIDGLNESIKTITYGFGMFIGVIVAGMTALAFASSSLVAATPAMYAVAGVIGVLGLSVTAMGYGVNLATTGISDMITSIAKLSTVNLDSLGNAFIPLNNFLNGDSKNLDKLEKFFNSKKELNLSNELFLQKFDKILSKGVELKAPTDGVNLTVNITNTLDGEVLGKKLALKVKAINYGYDKGR